MIYQFKSKLADTIIKSFKIEFTISLDEDTTSTSNIDRLLAESTYISNILKFNPTSDWIEWSKNLSGKYEFQAYEIFFEKEEDLVLYQLFWL